MDPNDKIIVKTLFSRLALTQCPLSPHQWKWADIKDVLQVILLLGCVTAGQTNHTASKAFLHTVTPRASLERKTQRPDQHKTFDRTRR